MKKILVIEDESSLRKGIYDVLKFEDFEVLEAENGKIGIQKAFEYLPDLILCDIMMPEIDGYEVLRQLRNSDLTNLIPFVFLTALTERSDVRSGMELGSDDYVSKPFTRDELLNVVNTRLKKSQEFNDHKDSAMKELRRNIITRLPHELRTPLNGILGYGQMLKDYPESVTLAELPRIGSDIYISAMRLFRLIENYLIYVRFEYMRYEKPILIELENPAEICKTEAIKSAENYNRLNDLELEISPGVLFVPHLDFAKIIEELVDNAFKFSEPGTKVRLSSGFEKGKFS